MGNICGAAHELGGRFGEVICEFFALARVRDDDPLIRPKLGGIGFGFLEWFEAAQHRLPYAEVEILPFFNLVMVWNQGVSFGLFNQTTDYGPLLLIAVSLGITIGFTVWLFKTRDMLKMIGIAMVIGGAIGNIIDRARFGAVIDFLDIHIAGWHYPAFNIADSAVVLGVFVLIIHAVFFEKTLQEPKEV